MFLDDHLYNPEIVDSGLIPEEISSILFGFSFCNKQKGSLNTWLVNSDL